MTHFLTLFSSPFFVLRAHSSKDVFPSPALPQGLGIFVINLDHCKERLSRTLSQLSCLSYPIHRVPGEYGLPDSQILSLIDQQAHRRILGKTMGPGTAGCLLSHIKAWKTFLASSYEWGLICEDDMKYQDTFPKILGHLIQQKNSFWDICSFHINHQGAPLTLEHYGFYRQTLYLFPVTGAGCYLLTRRGAKKLLSKAFPLTLPVDHYFTRGWEFPLVFTGIEPRCVVQDTSIVSEIEKRGRQTRTHLSFQQTLTRGGYVGAKHIIHMAYNGWIYLGYHLKKRFF